MFYAQMKIAAGVVGVMLMAGGTGVAIHQVAAADGRPIPPQAAPAATQPAATHPTVIDQSSPRGTFLSMYDAITNNDPSGVRQCIHTRNAAEAELADAMADQLTAQGVLNKLMQERLPPGGSIIPTRDQLKDLQQMITGEKGDKGVVIFGKMNFDVIKIDDKWYADAKSIFSPAKPTSLPLKRQAAEARIDADSFRAVTKELEEGKYKSVAEVRQAFIKRRMTAMRAATQPAASTAPPATTVSKRN